MFRAVRSNVAAPQNQEIARGLLRSQANHIGLTKLDTDAINRHVKFGIALNQAQTSTKRSFPAIIIKDLANRLWFEQSRPFRAEEVYDSIDLDNKLIRRLLHKLTDKVSFVLDGLDYWPSERLKKKIAELLGAANIHYEQHDSKVGLKVLEPAFSRLQFNTKALHEYHDQLSGRYLCVEQVLWKTKLVHPGRSTTASELSQVSRVPKSTLTTMLDQARSLGIIIERPDLSDARVTRWQLNMDNPLNAKRDQAYRKSFCKRSALHLNPI